VLADRCGGDVDRGDQVVSADSEPVFGWSGERGDPAVRAGEDDPGRLVHNLGPGRSRPQQGQSDAVGGLPGDGAYRLGMSGFEPPACAQQGSAAPCRPVDPKHYPKLVGEAVRAEDLAKPRGPIHLACGRPAEDRVVGAYSDQGVVGGRLVLGKLAPEEVSLVFRVLLGTAHRARDEQTRRRVVRQPRRDQIGHILAQVLVDVRKSGSSSRPERATLMPGRPRRFRAPSHDRSANIPTTGDGGEPTQIPTVDVTAQTNRGGGT
jgi:hypothetical protein